ncbi:MAG TPA: ImmA/IrrE family metallo-endopeptidase [Actinomycetota bacterium]|nr:ImmA/IrrE family metallo-endopeptidase [Actinomycetota bacterium]
MGADARADLVAEDPVAALEIYFQPLGIKALSDINYGGDCSVDGYYESMLDDARPWIFYSTNASDGRIRFTLLHELGHHLLQTSAAGLLDDIDVIAGARGGEAVRIEETICHQFAGRLLVPDELLEEVVGQGPLLPEHIIEMRTRSHASWEALVVRAADRLARSGAVVLLREPGTVGFASARGLDVLVWPRGSGLDPQGPLSRAFGRPQRAVPDVYGFGLPFSCQLFCDTAYSEEGIAVGVLSRKPSNGGLSILQELPKPWEQQNQACHWCNGERTEGWCENCSGPYCETCGNCGCSTLTTLSKVCPVCHMQTPFRVGATCCRDCE